MQLFSRYADETALDAPATKAQDIFKLKTHWWSKNKIAIQNLEASPVTFHVVNVPDRVLKKLGLGSVEKNMPHCTVLLCKIGLQCACVTASRTVEDC